MSAFAEVLKSLGGIVAVLGFLVAVFTYYRTGRTKRAEWLSSLHERFFETERYSRVRRVLDYLPEPEYSELSAAVTAEKHHPIADELYRYLNFFELLAGLRELKQISDAEIKGLFDYDLKLIREHEFIINILKPQGFERLDALLKTSSFLQAP